MFYLTFVLLTTVAIKHGLLLLYPGVGNDFFPRGGPGGGFGPRAQGVSGGWIQQI